MHAKKVDCFVSDLTYLSSEIVLITFRPNKDFSFSPGQFISIIIPGNLKHHKVTKRCYSFAQEPEKSIKEGYQICVKLVKGGVGSEFLKSLKVGDRFKAMVPFGDFKIKKNTLSKTLVLISTGTGIAPFRSMIGSKELKESSYRRIVLLHGVRNEEEIVFAGSFRAQGVESYFTVSQPKENWAGRKGRVTNLLDEVIAKHKPLDCDYYICGNGDMVSEVSDTLEFKYGVSKKNIIRENFSNKVKKAA